MLAVTTRALSVSHLCITGPSSRAASAARAVVVAPRRCLHTTSRAKQHAREQEHDEPDLDGLERGKGSNSREHELVGFDAGTRGLRGRDGRRAKNLAPANAEEEPTEKLSTVYNSLMTSSPSELAAALGIHSSSEDALIRLPSTEEKEALQERTSKTLERVLPDVEPAERRRELVGRLARPAQEEADWREQFTKEDYEELALRFAQMNDVASTTAILSALATTNHEISETLTADLFASLHGRPREAMALVGFAHNHSVSLPVAAHHHITCSLLSSSPSLALSHLFSLESAGITPLQATYTAAISYFLSSAAPVHLRQKGWDLYAHMRFSSHPLPSTAMYSALIASCGRGIPAPERAIDLFTEMTGDNALPPTREAYEGVIRSLARQGKAENFNEALRWTQEMLEENVAPGPEGWQALLEGCRTQGDLARARWVLVKLRLMEQAGEGKLVDGRTLPLVLQTYARFKPEAWRQPVGQKSIAAKRTKLVRRPEAKEAADVAAGTLATAEQESTQTEVEEVREEDLFRFPGPLPRDSRAVLAEVRSLLFTSTGIDVLSPYTPQISSTPTDSTQQGTTHESLTPYLLNSVLQVMAEHAPFPTLVAFFDEAYAAHGVERNDYAVRVVMREAAQTKDAAKGAVVAKRVFGEWRAAQNPTRQASAEGGQQKTPQNADEDQGEFYELYGGGSKTTSAIWSSLIRALARTHDLDAALGQLSVFLLQYPPKGVIDAACAFHLAGSKVPSFPSEMKLSSPSFPETYGPLDAGRPPHLLAKDLKLLELRLAEIEHKSGTKFVKDLVACYTGAVRVARDVEFGYRKPGKACWQTQAIEAEKLAMTAAYFARAVTPQLEAGASSAELAKADSDGAEIVQQA